MNNRETITYKLDGTKELFESMDALSSSEVNKLIKNAERKALDLYIIKTIKSALPYSQKTKKEIRIVAAKGKAPGFFAGAALDAYYLRFVEYGTKVRQLKRAKKYIPRLDNKGGENKGQITANPIIGKTINDNIENVISFFNKDFGEHLALTMEKKLKRINN